MIARPGADDELERWNERRRKIFYPKTDGFIDPTILKALKALSPAFIQRLRENLPALLETEIATIEYLQDAGTFHSLYRIRATDRAWLLKASLAQEASFGFLTEAWAARELKRVGLPALEIPEIRTTPDELPFAFMIIEEAPGLPLKQFEDPETQGMPWPILAELGRAAARIHTIETQGAGLLRAGEGRGVLENWSDYVLLRLEDHLRLCAEIGSIDSLEREEIRQRFAESGEGLTRSPKRLLHGDLGHHNVFGDRERITAIIDWEDALSGDPVFDIAYWGTFVRDEMRAEFLEGYAAITPLPSDFEYRYWLYYLRIALSKTVHRHHFGVQDRPGRPPASLRIQKALSNLRKL